MRWLVVAVETVRRTLRLRWLAPANAPRSRHPYPSRHRCLFKIRRPPQVAFVISTCGVDEHGSERSGVTLLVLLSAHPARRSSIAGIELLVARRAGGVTGAVRFVDAPLRLARRLQEQPDGVQHPRFIFPLGRNKLWGDQPG